MVAVIITLLLVKMTTWLTLQHLLQKQGQRQNTTHLHNSRETGHAEIHKQPEWVEWRETTDSGDPSDVLPNGKIQVGLELSEADAAEASSSTGGLKKNDETVVGYLPELTDEDPSSDPSENLIIVPYETMALPNKILDFSPVKGRQ